MSSITTSSGRRYPFVGGESVQVSIDDGGGRYLRHLAEAFPREFAKALKSTGYHLRKDLQDDAYRGGPREKRWSPLSGPHSARVFDDAKGIRRTPRTHPMGQLVRAIGYRYNAQTKAVHIGWLSHSAAKRGAELQRGFTTRVTPRMRRFYWALGIPVGKNTTVIRTPSRDLFSTVLRYRERSIQRTLEDKVHDLVRKSGRFAWAA